MPGHAPSTSSADVVIVGAGLAGLACGVRLGDGLYVAGDHRDTPSIQGALYSGRRCGEAVVTDLAAG